MIVRIRIPESLLQLPTAEVPGHSTVTLSFLLEQSTLLLCWVITPTNRQWQLLLVVVQLYWTQEGRYSLTNKHILDNHSRIVNRQPVYGVFSIRYGLSCLACDRWLCVVRLYPIILSCQVYCGR
jgi:hypothetical protein